MRSIANHVRPGRQSENQYILPIAKENQQYHFNWGFFCYTCRCCYYPLCVHWHTDYMLFLPPPPPPSLPPTAMLYSATFRKKVERLCRDVLTDPVRIVVGGVGEANEDITQVTEVMNSDLDKWVWLLKHLIEFTSGELEIGLSSFRIGQPVFCPSWKCVGICDAEGQC